MEDAIKLEIGGRDPEQVERLILDQAKCNDGLAHLEPFKNLLSLSMNDASISSLDKMPALDKLTTLKLNDNKIKTGLEPLSKLTALEKLYLGGNQIPDLAALAPLVKLSRLDWLDLEGNPVQEVADYTNEVFKMMPELRVLDGYNREGEEENDADDDDEVWARSPYNSAGGRMSVGRTTMRVRVFFCGIARCVATTVGGRTHGHVNMAAGVPTHCRVPPRAILTHALCRMTSQRRTMARALRMKGGKTQKTMRRRRMTKMAKTRTVTMMMKTRKERSTRTMAKFSVAMKRMRRRTMMATLRRPIRSRRILRLPRRTTRIWKRRARCWASDRSKTATSSSRVPSDKADGADVDEARLQRTLHLPSRLLWSVFFRLAARKARPVARTRVRVVEVTTRDLSPLDTRACHWPAFTGTLVAHARFMRARLGIQAPGRSGWARIGLCSAEESVAETARQTHRQTTEKRLIRPGRGRRSHQYADTFNQNAALLSRLSAALRLANY